jgi:cytochrome c peroxidase
MGLCGPMRHDQKDERGFCGLFRTPTLRNIATRGAFFHNGRFHSLREALEFYVERDTNPEKWYGKGAGGRVEKFDDLPASLRGNVDIVDEPLTRHPRQAPAWNQQEIDDVVAFLNTLTDADAKGPVASRAK